MHVVRRLNQIISKCRLSTNIIIVLFTAINIFTFIVEISNELKITYTSTYSGINGVLESIFLEWNDTVSYRMLFSFGPCISDKLYAYFDANSLNKTECLYS